MEVPVFVNPKNGMKFKVSVGKEKGHLCLPSDVDHSEHRKGAGESRIEAQGREAGELPLPIEPRSSRAYLALCVLIFKNIVTKILSKAQCKFGGRLSLHCHHG